MLAALLNLGFAGSEQAPVEVPDVVGETQAAGTATLEGEGFTVVVATAYSSVVPVGEIISQEPEGGEFASAGSIVTITVSLGEQPAPATGVGSSGGGGGIWYQGKRRKLPELNKQLDAILDAAEAEMLYGEIVAKASNPTKEQAAKLVKPYSETKREAIPETDSIDWQAVERDVTRTRRLFTLWRQMQIDEEDDDFLLLN